MSDDDDQIRRALRTGTPRVTAHAALRETLPSMQRARVRRRVAVSATAAALLIGGGAGVFALTASRDQTTLRSVTSDQPDQPPATATEFEVSSTTVSTSVAGARRAAYRHRAAARSSAHPDSSRRRWQRAGRQRRAPGARRGNAAARHHVAGSARPRGACRPGRRRRLPDSRRSRAHAVTSSSRSTPARCRS